MKKILIMSIALLLVLTGCQSKVEPESELEKETEPTVTVDDGALATIATEFFDLYIGGDFEAAYQAGLDATMKDAFKPEMMAQVHEQIEQTYGAYDKKIGNKLSESQGFKVVSIGGQHANKDLVYNVVFNGAGEISGFHYNELTNANAFENPPESTDTNMAILFGEDAFNLEGTLLLPEGEGPFPAVVLVHGSGPSDRDESVYGNKPFKDIAEGLVEKGIAVLRYDKRTYTHAQKFTDQTLLNNFTIYEETIYDARYAVDYLKNVESIDADQIYVLGHSLGGNQAPRIAKGRSDIAGIVVMGGNVTPLQELMVDQYHYLYSLQEALDEAEEAQIQAQLTMVEEAAEKIGQLSETTTYPAEELMGIPSTYWMDLKDYDPTEVAKTLEIPILVLQGARDYQVPLEEFEKWQAALGDKADYQLYEGLNHLFMEGEGRPSPEEYQNPGHVSERLIEDLAQWILNKK